WKLTKPKAKSDSCEPCYARPANSGWSWFMQLRFLRAKTMSYILFDERSLGREPWPGQDHGRVELVDPGTVGKMGA
ncbi:hypothetical protein, partial [Pseudomonas sp.]|uniref:hypothetical protein n=1 Tax=Pseudomonas sp. TaxID=306 RepID=UPI003567050F